jgi:hypothetical protein
MLLTLSQGEGTRDSCVPIDHFQWPLLGRYLFEVYLAPHPLDSLCASHVLLAVKEHLVCGANSHCFSHTQKLSLKANRDCSWTLRMSSPKRHLSLSRKKTYHEVGKLSLDFWVHTIIAVLLGWSLSKVSLTSWWAPLNCNVALNCAGSSRRFSSQYCKIESVYLSD